MKTLESTSSPPRGLMAQKQHQGCCNGTLLSVCLLCSIRILSPGGGGFGCGQIDAGVEDTVTSELKTSEAYTQHKAFHKEEEEVSKSSGSVAAWQRQAESA